MHSYSMQKDDDWSSLRLDLGSCINEFHGRHGVMINSSHVDFASWEGRTLHNSIVTKNASVSATINKRATITAVRGCLVAAIVGRIA